MKGRINKSLFFILFFAALIMVIDYNVPSSINKYIRTITNQSKLEGSCYTGDGTIMYVDVASGTVPVRDSASNSANVLYRVNRCTEIIVYCTSGNYYKISKVHDYWISKDYVLESRPNRCDSLINTTTSTISFDLSDPIYTVESGYDQMYADKNGKIRYNVKNILNAASDDQRLFDVKITKGSTDVTGDFLINKSSIIAGQMDIDISQLSSNTYQPGNYTVTVKTEKTTRSKNFTLVGYFYDFDMITELKTDHPYNPVNRKNIWDITLKNLVNINKSKLRVEITKDGVIKNANFNITTTTEGYRIYNLYDRFNRPVPGNYTLTIYYVDETFSSSRGIIFKQFDFSLGMRIFTFDEDHRESHRYIRSREKQNYSLKLTSIITNSGITTINYIEDGVKTYLLRDEFESIYVDLDLSRVNVASDGKIVYKYDENVTVVKYLNNKVYYHNDENPTIVEMSKTDFMSTFPDAYNGLTSGEFSFDAYGYLQYNKSGIKSVEVSKLSPQNQTLFAASGGEFSFIYSYTELDTEDFSQMEYQIYRIDGSKVGEDQGFIVDWHFDSQKVYFTITCDVRDTLYVGDYYLELTLKDAVSQRIHFHLYSGDIDFYVKSQVDDHNTLEDALQTELPPANKRYEQYVGFYLIEGGKLATTKNVEMINVKIYDHAADLDEHGNLYYYDQVDYITKITRVHNSTVYFDLSLDGGAYESKTMSTSEFAIKYSDAFALLEKYKFDANGYIINDTDNFELHIKKLYNDPNTTETMVVYTDQSNQTHTVTKEELKVMHPKMYGYLETRFVFNGDDIEVGSIMGSYRITQYNGNPIVGHEVTDNFNITIDYDASNVEKPIKILPKTEVNAGVYYVYVQYDTFQGVGYINDGSAFEDALGNIIPENIPVSEDLFPEMWMQNIHMTRIKYGEPEYALSIDNVAYSNTGNAKTKAYYNIDGKIVFDVNLKYIYNKRGISYIVEKQNGANWDNVTNKFTIINTMDPDSSSYEEERNAIELNIKPKITEEGNYRLTVNYLNNGQSATTSQEFIVSGKYYGLVIDESIPKKFIHNYTSTQEFNAKAYNIPSTSRIVPSITRYIDGVVDEELVYDEANKCFKNKDGRVFFTYEILFTKDYYEEDISLYQFSLSNVGNVTTKDKYTLKFTYIEDDNDVSESKVEFFVDEDEYHIEVLNQEVKANALGELLLIYDIKTSYISYADLNKITNVIYYANGATPEVVSSGNKKMFSIEPLNWDLNSGPDFEGKITIKIDPDVIDWRGSYSLITSFMDYSVKTTIRSLDKLFDWKISDVKISGSYFDTELNETVNVEDFYHNINNTSIEISIESPHDNDVNWVINKTCLANTCDPTTGTDFNNRFNAINTTGTNKKLILNLKDDLAESEKLSIGQYALVLYYSSTDMRRYIINVNPDYVSIKLGDPIIYTEISQTKTIDALYSDKDGFIFVPVKIIGVNYQEVKDIKIMDENEVADYTNNFNVKKDDPTYINNHILEVDYNGNASLEAKKYKLVVSYDIDEHSSVMDYIYFDINPTYFDFEISNPTYEPNPLVPNENGKITFNITTENIPNVMLGENNIDSLSNKHKFARNAVIRDQKNNDVTSSFNIVAVNASGSFNLVLTYVGNEIEPGVYTMTTHYEVGGLIIRKTKEFVVGEYKKSLIINNIEIISTTKDNQIHKNIPGTYRIHYTSIFEIYSSNISVKVYNSNNEDVTDKFNIDIYDEYIDLVYRANPVLNGGVYQVMITYQESGNISVSNKTIVLSGEYKEIKISNIAPSASIIYADKENQYYTFDVDTDSMTDTDIANLKARIYDKNNRLVYSDITEDNINNIFSVNNNLKTASANYKINILAFKSLVGDYQIQLLLSDNEGSYNVSNKLDFSVNSTFYKVKLSNDSTIVPNRKYNNEDAIYHNVGGHGSYKFTSNYPTASDYSILVMKGYNVVKQIDVDLEELTEYGVNYLTTEFDLTGIDPGNYEVALAIKGLPYVSKNIDILEYIPATKVSIKVGDTVVNDRIEFFMGQTKELSYVLEPVNATNKEFTYTASNNVLSITNNRLYVENTGESVITLSNGEIDASITVVSIRRLTSSVYKVRLADNIIYVDTMTTKKLSKETFINNLQNVSPNYQLFDSKNNNVTHTMTNITTGTRIESNGESYTIVIIGDINRDGEINVIDVSMLYSHIKGNRINDKYSLLAADIRKHNDINVIDVSKLYTFIKNRVDKL